MLSAEDVFRLSNTVNNRAKTSNAKLKRKINEKFKTKLKKLFHKGGRKVKETLIAKFTLKSVRVNLKNIHMPKQDDVVNDDLHGIPWYNRVKYQCLPCGKYLWVKLHVHKHVKQFHKIKESTLNFYCLLSEDDEYVCMICNSVIKLEYNNVNRHLNNVHQAKLSEYGSVYESDKTFNTERTDLQPLHDSECLGIIWYNRVTFQCKFCEKKVIGCQNIKIHIRRIHTKKYPCKLCEKEISLNYTAIWKHVDIVYDITNEIKSQRKMLKTIKKDVPNSFLPVPPYFLLLQPLQARDESWWRCQTHGGGSFLHCGNGRKG